MHYRNDYGAMQLVFRRLEANRILLSVLDTGIRTHKTRVSCLQERHENLCTYIYFPGLIYYFVVLFDDHLFFITRW